MQENTKKSLPGSWARTFRVLQSEGWVEVFLQDVSRFCRTVAAVEDFALRVDKQQEWYAAYGIGFLYGLYFVFG